MDVPAEELTGMQEVPASGTLVRRVLGLVVLVAVAPARASAEAGV